MILLSQALRLWSMCSEVTAALRVLEAIAARCDARAQDATRPLDIRHKAHIMAVAYRHAASIVAAPVEQAS